MDSKNLATNIVNALITKNVKDVSKYLVFPNSDEITNTVRKQLNNLSTNELKSIQLFLYDIFNSCYNENLFNTNTCIKLPKLTSSTLFLLKENIIYYLGRLPLLPDINILEKAYKLDKDLHIKLNITFSSLSTFDERIERDFISKVSPGNSYDLLIRSWTLAFFSNCKTPYNFQDIHNNDWSKAKAPRLKRLAINSTDNPKFLKAMSFRALDLLVLYLFLENRKTDVLTKEESDIVSSAFIEYPKFSKIKIQFLKSLKEKLGAKYSS